MLLNPTHKQRIAGRMLREPYRCNPNALHALFMLAKITEDPALFLSRALWPHLCRDLDRICTLTTLMRGMAARPQSLITEH